MRKNRRIQPFILMGMLVLLLVLAVWNFAIAEQAVEGTGETNGIAADAALELEDEDAVLQQEMEQVLANVQETEVVEAEGEAVEDDMVINILLIGTDERKRAFSENARGDTCMLCSVNARTRTIKLISFERAIGVEILEGEHESEWDWLTHMFSYGGAELMVREIQEHFKIDVTKYVRVNLHTFVELVDAVDGIDIELTAAEADYINGPDGQENARDIDSIHELQRVQPGPNHLNGATALVYARCRKLDSDWNRISRQRNVIIAAAKQLMTSDAEGMANALLSMLPLVQTNISLAEAVPLAMLAPELTVDSIEQMSIPAEGTYGSKQGMDGRSMYSVDFNMNAKIINDFLYQE